MTNQFIVPKSISDMPFRYSYGKLFKKFLIKIPHNTDLFPAVTSLVYSIRNQLKSHYRFQKFIL